MKGNYLTCACLPWPLGRRAKIKVEFSSMCFSFHLPPVIPMGSASKNGIFFAKSWSKYKGCFYLAIFIYLYGISGEMDKGKTNFFRPFDNFAPLHICNNKQIEYTTNWWHLPLGQVNIVNFCNKIFIKFIRETLPCTFCFPFLYQYVFQWLSKLLLTNKRLHNVLWD